MSSAPPREMIPGNSSHSGTADTGKLKLDKEINGEIGGYNIFLGSLERMFFFYSWRGFNTPPLCGGHKGIKPETNTFKEQPYPDRSAAGLVDLSHSLELADSIIAATALEYHEVLLTANEKHYGFIPNIEINRFLPG